MSTESAVLTLAVCYGAVMTIFYIGIWATLQIIKKRHQNQVEKVNANIQQSNAQTKTMVARLQGCSTLEEVDNVLADFGIVRITREKSK